MFFCTFLQYVSIIFKLLTYYRISHSLTHILPWPLLLPLHSRVMDCGSEQEMPCKLLPKLDYSCRSPGKWMLVSMLRPARQMRRACCLLAYLRVLKLLWLRPTVSVMTLLLWLSKVCDHVCVDCSNLFVRVFSKK